MNLVSHVWHEKHHKHYLNLQVKDDTWLKIAQQLGYNEDEADIYLLTLFVG